VKGSALFYVSCSTTKRSASSRTWMQNRGVTVIEE